MIVKTMTVFKYLVIVKIKACKNMMKKQNKKENKKKKSQKIKNLLNNKNKDFFKIRI